jgi:very-short-patch-repair endonuclease
MDRQHGRRDPESGVCRITGTPAHRERAVARLAGTQHGVVTRKQLLELGWSRDAVENRLKAGRLHALHRGVYLLGHAAPPPHAREMAALLACGPGAVISHHSAAYVLELLPSPADLRVIDVTVGARHRGSRPRIRLHRPAHALDPRDISAMHRIPITKPARTLVDLAGSAESRDVERALAQAFARRMVNRAALDATLTRAGRARGVARLRRLLDRDGEPALTRSEAEDRLLDLVRRARLPYPAVNVRVSRFEVDFLWRAQRLVVEVDGFQFHSSRSAFERDRARDAELHAHGFRVMRLTWRRIAEEPEATVALLAQALAMGRG